MIFILLYINIVHSFIISKASISANLSLEQSILTEYPSQYNASILLVSELSLSTSDQSSTVSEQSSSASYQSLSTSDQSSTVSEYFNQTIFLNINNTVLSNDSIIVNTMNINNTVLSNDSINNTVLSNDSIIVNTMNINNNQSILFNNSIYINNITNLFKPLVLLSSSNDCNYVQIKSGQTAYVACGSKVSESDLTKYNPGVDFTKLNVGQYICCSSGPMPNFKPSKNSDGTCATYKVVSGDTCTAISSKYYPLSIDEIERYNKNNFGWKGCNNLQIDYNLCISEGNTPRPTPNPKAECGPLAPGDKYMTDCPLNACCSEFGFCGLTAEFCDKKLSNTGAPGTDGCYSNCGYGSLHSDVRGDFEKIAYWMDAEGKLSIDPNDFINQYDIIHYAFVDINQDFTINGNNIDRSGFLDLQGVKRVASFGGWEFSTNPNTYNIFRNGVKKENRDIFAYNLIKFMDDYGLDGIDLDWEYPGAPDIPGIPPDDPDNGKNYLEFVKILRNRLTAGKTLSMAIPSSYWYLKNYPIKEIQQYLDYMVFMTYDIYGTWDIQRDNAIRCHTNLTAINDALKMLDKAGVEIGKTYGGIANYGRSYKASSMSCLKENCAFSGPGNQRDITKTPGVLADSEIIQINASPAKNDRWTDSISDCIFMRYDSDSIVSWPRNRDDTTKYFQNHGLKGSVLWAMNYFKNENNEKAGNDLKCTLVNDIEANSVIYNCEDQNAFDKRRSMSYNVKEIFKTLASVNGLTFLKHTLHALSVYIDVNNYLDRIILQDDYRIILSRVIKSWEVGLDLIISLDTEQPDDVILRCIHNYFIIINPDTVSLTNYDYYYALTQYQTDKFQALMDTLSFSVNGYLRDELAYVVADVSYLGTYINILLNIYHAYESAYQNIYGAESIKDTNVILMIEMSTKDLYYEIVAAFKDIPSSDYLDLYTSNYDSDFGGFTGLNKVAIMKNIERIVGLHYNKDKLDELAISVGKDNYRSISNQGANLLSRTLLNDEESLINDDQIGDIVNDPDYEPSDNSDEEENQCKNGPKSLKPDYLYYDYCRAMDTSGEVSDCIDFMKNVVIRNDDDFDKKMDLIRRINDNNKRNKDEIIKAFVHGYKGRSVSCTALKYLGIRYKKVKKTYEYYNDYGLLLKVDLVRLRRRKEDLRRKLSYVASCCDKKDRDEFPYASTKENNRDIIKSRNTGSFTVMCLDLVENRMEGGQIANFYNGQSIYTKGNFPKVDELSNWNKSELDESSERVVRDGEYYIVFIDIRELDCSNVAYEPLTSNNDIEKRKIFYPTTNYYNI